jgi:hypothetical protein
VGQKQLQIRFAHVVLSAFIHILSVAPNYLYVFVNSAWTANVTVPAGVTLRIVDGLTLNNATVTLDIAPKSSSELEFFDNGNATLGGTGQIEIGAIGTVTCGGCGNRHFVSVGGDPLHSTFRDYTSEECQTIVAEFQAGIDSRCPVDGTVMVGVGTKTLGAGTHAVVQCKRCGRSAQNRSTT